MNFEFECNECSNDLSVHVYERCGDITIIVEPCERCLKEAEDNGFEEGRNEGYDEGYADGQEGTSV